MEECASKRSIEKVLLILADLKRIYVFFFKVIYLKRGLSENDIFFKICVANKYY